jgi:hypothetical protein
MDNTVNTTRSHFINFQMFDLAKMHGDEKKKQGCMVSLQRNKIQVPNHCHWLPFPHPSTLDLSFDATIWSTL